MSSYASTQSRAFAALVALACLLPAWRLLADPDHCAVCGGLFGTRVYTIEDMVTGQKVQVCSDCATLSTVCFICGLPAKTNYTQLPDSRILCARDARHGSRRKSAEKLEGVVQNPIPFRVFSDAIHVAELGEQQYLFLQHGRGVKGQRFLYRF